MSNEPMECSDEVVAVTETSKDHPSSVFHLNDADVDILDLHDTKLIEALYDFMEGHEEGVSNAVIANVIGILESKYRDHSEASSFDDCVKLVKLTFENETTDGLVEAIHHFDPVTNECSRSEPSRKPFIIKCQDVVAEVGRDFFELKLRHTIDQMFERPADYAIDQRYVQILNICVNSKMAFRYFSAKVAKTMIEHQFPENIQTFLDQFIFDVRLRKNSIEDFCQMYSDDLYFYVRILTDLESGSQMKSNGTVDSLMINLRSKNTLNFVILATHFKMFEQLLKKMKNSPEKYIK